MNTPRLFIARATIAWCCVLGAASLRAEAGEVRSPTITATANWSGVLAESKVEFDFNLEATDEPIDGVVAWNLIANRRVLARGEVPVEIAADKTAATTITFDAPAVADAVVLETELKVALLDGGGRELAQTTRPVRIFAADPFFGRKRWLEEVDVALFDPLRNTVKQFDEVGVPYQFFRSVDALKASRPRVVIIGEGVSLARQRGLADALYELAATGSSVLLLAPRDGNFPLSRNGVARQPQQMHFARREIIGQLNKRLDAISWQGDDPIAVTMALAANQGEIGCEFQPHNRGWSWLEITFASDDNHDEDTRLIVCGFAIIEHWNSGPTPRYLFAQILERLSAASDSPSSAHRSGGLQSPQNQ